MHTLRDTWDNILRNMVDNLAEISKRDLLFRKMEGSKELSEDMAHHRRLPEGHEDKSYAWLQTCIVRALTKGRTAQLGRSQRDRSREQSCSRGRFSRG